MAAIVSGLDDTVGVTVEDGQRTRPAPVAEITGGYRKGTRWERFVELTCFVCCGVERGADGQVVPAVIPGRGRQENPTSQPMMTGARGVGERRSTRGDRFQRFGGDGWMY